MSTKFNAYYQSNANSSPDFIGSFNSIEEAARACDNKIHGDRNHECIKSILERQFYMIGYGPSLMYVDVIEN